MEIEQTVKETESRRVGKDGVDWTNIMADQASLANLTGAHHESAKDHLPFVELGLAPGPLRQSQESKDAWSDLRLPAEQSGETRKFIEKMEAQFKKEDAAAANFVDRMTESAKLHGLDKTELAPVLNEMVKQLASGKLDATQLQELMKKVNLPADQLEKLTKKLEAFSKDMTDLYGLKVDFKFNEKDGKVGVASVSVGELKELEKPRTSVNVSTDSVWTSVRRKLSPAKSSTMTTHSDATAASALREFKSSIVNRE